MGYFAHAQTIDTRPFFPPPTNRPGYEASACYDVNTMMTTTFTPNPSVIGVSSMMKILAARKTKYRQPVREIQVVTWEPHCDDCKVCQKQSHGKRGRPKKIPGHGCQAGETINLIVAHVRDESGSRCAQNVSPERIISYSINSSHLTCPLCHHIVDGPIHLKCGQLVASVPGLPRASICPPPRN